MLQLTYLSLLNNRIGDVGMQVFAAALSGGSGALPALEYLDVDELVESLVAACEARGIIA